MLILRNVTESVYIRKLIVQRRTNRLAQWMVQPMRTFLWVHHLEGTGDDVQGLERMLMRKGMSTQFFHVDEDEDEQQFVNYDGEDTLIMKVSTMSDTLLLAIYQWTKAGGFYAQNAHGDVCYVQCKTLVLHSVARPERYIHSEVLADVNTWFKVRSAGDREVNLPGALDDGQVAYQLFEEEEIPDAIVVTAAEGRAVIAEVVRASVEAASAANVQEDVDNTEVLPVGTEVTPVRPRVLEPPHAPKRFREFEM